MSRRRGMPCLAAAFCFSFFAAVGHAATYPIDDSASLPGQASTIMHWRTLGPSRRAGNIVDGANAITVSLDTSRFVGRNGKIYMVLPEQPIGPVSVDWTTQGRFLPGALVSGSRSLVYAGMIREKMLSDTLDVRVHTDGTRLTTPQRLRFSFEIDVE